MTASIVLSASFLAAALPKTVVAQDYPTRPVRIILPYAAGGPTDLLARVFADKMRERLKQGVVVENRPGGRSIPGTAALAQSAPDGYTIMVSNLPEVSKILIKDPPYDTECDFDPVAGIANSIYVLGVNTALPVRNVKELIEYVCARSGQLNYANPYVTSQLMTEMLKYAAKVDIVGVPYKTSAPGIQGVLANEVQMVFDVASSLTPHR